MTLTLLFVDVQGGLSGGVYAVAVLPNCWQSVVTSPGESGPL